MGAESGRKVVGDGEGGETWRWGGKGENVTVRNVTEVRRYVMEVRRK